MQTMPNAKEAKAPRTKSAHPKDAATLILVKHAPKGAKVLMGKRSAGHDFMPDKYVFPGGRVERTDALMPSIRELSAMQSAYLSQRSRRIPRGFALCAIRETFEETGLIVGRACDTVPKAPLLWRDYASHNAIPDLHDFQFIGRAVTPPFRPKRFDARFFMADADKVLLDQRHAQSGAELIDVQWVDLQAARALDLPSVTRFMLDEIAFRLANPEEKRPIPFWRWRYGDYGIEHF